MGLDKTRFELAVIREKCDEDLLFFTCFFYKELQGRKFIVNGHHKEICNELKKVENYEYDLLNINIPPRFSKTELAAVNFIARGIGMNPSSNWLYITASDELRSETSVRVREIVSHPYFQIMYGVQLKKDQKAKNLWRTTEGGGLKTATIFGQITGFGAGQMIDHSDLEEHLRDFEGCIVLDDINKTDDSETENAKNEKVTRTIFNTLMSRKNSKDTPIINIQQRAGLTDATQQFIEHYGEDNARAKFLVMPVIKDGVPLWEWKHSLKDIEDLKTSPKTAHVFTTQYMQIPVKASGLCFPSTELKYFDNVPDPDSTIGFIDVADKGNDSLSFPIGKIQNKLIYIDDVIFTKDQVTKSNPRTAQMMNKHLPEWVRVESNGGGSLYIDLLQESQKINEDVNLLGVTTKGNKHTKIMAWSAFILKYCRFRKDYEPDSEYAKFIKELTTYAKDGTSKHDDAPDSLVGLCTIAKRFYSHIWEDAPENDAYGKD